MDNIISNITEPLKNAPHPFYPLDAKVVGYLASEYSVPGLLGTFFAGCAVILGLTSAIIGRNHKILSGGDKAAVLWNVLSKLRSVPTREIILTKWAIAAGFIHLFFEGSASMRNRYSSFVAEEPQGTLHTTMPAWLVKATSSGRCGKSTLSRTPDT